MKSQVIYRDLLQKKLFYSGEMVLALSLTCSVTDKEAGW